MGAGLEIMDDEESHKVNPDKKLTKKVKYIGENCAWIQRIWADRKKGRHGADEALSRYVNKIYSSFFDIRNARVNMWQREASLQRAGDCLVRSGTVAVLCEVVCLSMTREAVPCLKQTVAVLANYANASEQVCVAVGGHPNLLTNLRDYLVTSCQLTITGRLLFRDENLTTGCLTLFVNVASRDHSVQFVRNVPGVFEMASIYLSAENILKFQAIKLMATVATEQQAKTMTQGAHILRFVLHHLRVSLQDPDGVARFPANHIRLTIVNFANAVKQLSRNEANSQQLVELGVLPLLYQGLCSNSHQDRNECIGALWWLSFNRRNRTAIAREAYLVDLVTKIFHNPQDPCQQAAEGILFQMRNVDARAKKTMGRVAMDGVNPGGATAPERDDNDQSANGHVMLSYQTGCRHLVKTVCDFLKSQGISVWMDIYDMADGETSTAQTMAEAVEKAAVFLMGVSEGYKNSQYCRSEAEYAFENKKQIIPLKLQPGYRPDGWLGFIQGSKYFYDLTKDEVRDQKLEQLLKAVLKAYGTRTDSTNTESGGGGGGGGDGGGGGGGGGGGSSAKPAE